MATAIVGLTELMGAFGFDTALIQRQDTQRTHYDTAWTFSVIFGVAIAILLLTLAIPAAEFYREPRLTAILPVLAAGALIAGFENIGTVAFRKELNFGAEFRLLFAKRISTFIVTIGLAVVFRNYWSLIAGIFTGKVVSVLIGYRMHPYRPRFSLTAAKELMHFSKWLFFSNLIQFLQGRSTDFVLGRIVGVHGLGLYNIAAEIALLPSTELIAPLNRAVFPVYSQIAADSDKLLSRFREVFGVIALLAFPVTFGISVVAEDAVMLLLGPKWIEAVPIMQMLAFSGLAAALQSNLYLVIVAMGMPKASTIFSGLVLLVALPSLILFSASYGAAGAAASSAISALIGLIGISYVFVRLTKCPPAWLLLSIWRPLTASAGMALVVTTVKVRISDVVAPSTLDSLYRLTILIACGTLSYVLLTMGLWMVSGKPNSSEQTIFQFIRTKILGRFMSIAR
jgi:O-antigen/teichoic acid export membrane protein